MISWSQAMFQVTLREMLWLCAVAALAIGWLLHTRGEQTDDQFLQIQLMEQRLDQASELVAQLESVLKSQTADGAKQME